MVVDDRLQVLFESEERDSMEVADGVVPLEVGFMAGEGMGKEEAAVLFVEFLLGDEHGGGIDQYRSMFGLPVQQGMGFECLPEVG